MICVQNTYLKTKQVVYHEICPRSVTLEALEYDDHDV